jgi:HEAT repeat protein
VPQLTSAEGQFVAFALRGILREVPPPLASERGSSDPRTRALVAAALSGLAAERSNSLICLGELLGDPSADIRLLVIDLLGELGADARPLAEPLAARLADEVEDVRAAARFAFGRVAPDLAAALPSSTDDHLIEKLRDIARQLAEQAAK